MYVHVMPWRHEAYSLLTSQQNRCVGFTSWEDVAEGQKAAGLDWRNAVSARHRAGLHYREAPLPGGLPCPPENCGMCFFGHDVTLGTW